MERIYIGIDPGVSGALGVVHGDFGAFVDTDDMPVMIDGKTKRVNPHVLTALLWSYFGTFPDAKATIVIERVGAMPGQGVSSMFNFGHSAGILEGVAAALGVPVVLVTPGQWKKHYRLTGKDKDSARTLAVRTYPVAAEQLKRKKDVGRADALLLARYGWMTSTAGA